MEDKNFDNGTGQNNTENKAGAEQKRQLPAQGSGQPQGARPQGAVPPNNGQPQSARPQGAVPPNNGPYNNGAYSNGPQNNGPYNNGQYNNGQYRGNNQYQKKKKKSSIFPVIIILIAVILLFLTVFSFMLRVMSSSFMRSSRTDSKTRINEELHYTRPYIGVIGINGTIEGDNGNEISSQTYHHTWTLKKLKQLKEDTNNRGLIITVNTPGGGVYESDELYYAIKEYKEETGRPVYSYMESQATSGGYYISAPCDKILANRNCWTGSIGVTIGTIYDITGLLEKYGVKTVTITAGKNKAMGSYTEELTKEQQAILQGLVDEAYDQFVGIVSEGRGMSKSDVEKLADGRIYTAKQAKKNGLIDEICRYDEAVEDMKKRFELESCDVNKIEYKYTQPLLYRLLMETAEIGRSKADTELDGIKTLMDENDKFTVTYLAEVRK